MTDGSESAEARIDEFVERTKARIGEPIVEGEPWNTGVTADQARIFLNGLGDTNPCWDPDTPGTRVHPAYLTSVRYPQLHGEPMAVPMSSFVADLEYEWHEPIRIGDDVDATAVIDEVFEKRRDGRRYVFIISEVTYDRERDGRRLATAGATQLLVTGEEGTNFQDREVHAYDGSERDEIAAAYEAELDRLESVPRTPDAEDVRTGDDLPPVVRGPLTIADMVCWQSAAPPTYGSSIVNYVQRKQSPHNTITNPTTGWMQKSSHQHEDVWLCEGRGMPLPFGNGVMMYAWTSIPMTNWMGADGRLRRHRGHIRNPLFYGDTLWIEPTVTELADEGDERVVTVTWAARNQFDETVLDGESEVVLPREGA